MSVTSNVTAYRGGYYGEVTVAVEFIPIQSRARQALTDLNNAYDEAREHLSRFIGEDDIE